VRELGLNDRVVFTGQVSDPFAWMMRARVAVCASIYEGLCNAIIEALACGTPVVSTNCPYGPFEILQGARFGALTPVAAQCTLRRTLHRTLHPDSCRPLWPKCGQSFAATRVAYG